MNNQNIPETEGNLFKFLVYGWQNKRPSLLRLLFVSILTIIVLLSIPNTYRSYATLSAKIDDGISSSSIASALGSFAGLAGINPSQGNASTKDIALESINSFSFFKELYRNDDFLVNLMAVKGHDGNSTLIDEKLYDSRKKIWIDKKPHPQDAYDIYTKKVAINEDDFKPIITISVFSRSPYAAKDMNDLILAKIDDFIKTKDVNESKKAIEYLKKEISITQIPDVKDALSKMITQYMSKMVTSEKSETYLFNLIEKPFAPIEKYSPKRAIVCIQVFIVFFFIELLLLYFSFSFNKAIKFNFRRGFYLENL